VIWWATEPVTSCSDLTCLTTYLSTPPERDTHPILTWIQLPEEEYKLVNILVQQLSNANNAGVSPSGFLFFPFFLKKKQVLLCLSCGRWRISQTLKYWFSYHLGLSPIMRSNELWTCTDDGAARAQDPGYQRSSCWVRSKRKRRGPMSLVMIILLWDQKFGGGKGGRLFDGISLLIHNSWAARSGLADRGQLGRPVSSKIW